MLTSGVEKGHSGPAVFKHDAPVKEFDDVERRILAVTSILQKMDRQHSPTTTNSSQIPPFLRHLATLLTCGDETGADYKKSVAFIGSLTAEGLRILVVKQNPFKSGDRAHCYASSTKVNEIKWNLWGGGERVGMSSNAPHAANIMLIFFRESSTTLQRHISDIWAAIASYDPHDMDQFHLFCYFIITRCFQEFSVRVFQDRRAWNVNVQKTIFDCRPLNGEFAGVRWIDWPEWALLTLPAMNIDGLLERTIDKSGRPVIQWQLSNPTLCFWARLLATIINKVELAVDAARTMRETQKGDEKGEIENIHAWCHRLYAYLYWKEDVVQILLTSLSEFFNFPIALNTGGQ